MTSSSTAPGLGLGSMTPGSEGGDGGGGVSGGDGTSGGGGGAAMYHVMSQPGAQFGPNAPIPDWRSATQAL